RRGLGIDFNALLCLCQCVYSSPAATYSCKQTECMHRKSQRAPALQIFFTPLLLDKTCNIAHYCRCVGTVILLPRPLRAKLGLKQRDYKRCIRLYTSVAT
ncbi:unnamed protein product, partial [Ceratitis capitata]